MSKNIGVTVGVRFPVIFPAKEKITIPSLFPEVEYHNDVKLLFYVVMIGTGLRRQSNP